MAKLPPIVQEFRAHTDLSQVIRTARTFATHLAALADDLAEAEKDPADGLIPYEVRLHNGTIEGVSALDCFAEDGWLCFYRAGGVKAAFFAASAVESVRRLR